MPGSVTLYLTSASAGAGNFQIYHTSADPSNLIAQNVTSASLASGYCTSEVYDTYIVKSDTPDCQNQVLVYASGAPAPTPTPTPTPTGTTTTLPTLTNGWRITMGEIDFGGNTLRGLHRGTLYLCPSPYGYGAGSSPTTTTTALPGTNCYWTSVLGPNFDKEYGINGIGAASSYALTMFSTDVGSGFSTFGIINTSGTGNPGSGGISGTIVGNNSTSGTWSVNYSATTTYVDQNGSGTSYTPESTGTLTLSGISLVNGVTYNINI